MAYERREGDCIIFQQTNKKNPKGPDWKGEGLVAGVEVELAFWIKRGAKCEFLTGSVKPKGQRSESRPEPQSQPLRQTPQRPAQRPQSAAGKLLGETAGTDDAPPFTDEEIPF